MTRAAASFLLLLAAHGATLDAARPRTVPSETALPAPGVDTSTSPGVLASGNPIVPVQLIARSGQFREQFVQQIRQEAEAIWQRSGVTIVWRGGAPSACDAQLKVWLARTAQRRVVPQAAMGSILFDHGVPLPLIHLSVENVEILLRSVPSTSISPAIHDTQVARALGRALAHEIGHYVLSRQTHERQGLMRASWPIQEAVAPDRRSFELMPDQRAAALGRLAAERAACAGADAVDQ